MAERPRTEEELQKREAIGVIRASRFVRKFAQSHKIISVETIKEIHAEIFNDAWSDIAGMYRTENLKITDSSHVPPHHSLVPKLMNEKAVELEKKLQALEHAEGIIRGRNDNTPKVHKTVDQVIQLAAWVHYSVTCIHPFRDGNGRTARLAGNLILERFGLIGISIKVEKENKNRYRQALAQIDNANDYKPLVSLIYEGLRERYDGVALKQYGVKK
jgi:Fic family protein